MSYCKLDTPLFQNLMILDTDFFYKKYVPGQIVPENIKSIPVVGIVMKGVLDVYSIAYDGTDIHLNILKKNDCFGISNLFLPTELQTVITSRTNVEILYIPKKIITKQLACNSNFALDYASYCNEKIQFLIKRIEFLTIQSCRGKVIEYLTTNMNRNLLVQIPYSKELLAKNLGISRAALFRELSYLKKNDIIEINDSFILIRNQKKLEELLYQLD